MELSSKALEQIAFNLRPKNQEHMLVVMDKSAHGEHLAQPLQTNIKQYKIAVTFLIGYNGIFNHTNSIKKFYFMKSITDEDRFIQISISPGAYEIESLNNEINRNIIDKAYYSENEYPFTMKPNFSTLGSIIEILPQGPIISFMFDNGIRDLLGLNGRTLYEDYNLSPNPVDILNFTIFSSKQIMLEDWFSAVKDVEYIIILLWMSIQGINSLKNSEEYSGIWWRDKILFHLFASN